MSHSEKFSRTLRKNFRLREDLHAEICNLAKQRGVTFTALVHQGLQTLLEQDTPTAQEPPAEETEIANLDT